MGSRAILVALAAGLAAIGCGTESAGDPNDHPVSAGSTAPRAYPGDIGSGGCASHWFTGDDKIAKFTCDLDAYRIAFDVDGQESVLTQIAAATAITVDATVRGIPASRILDPGIGCWKDENSGWIASLGTKSRYLIVAYGESSPLRAGKSAAVRRLAAWNHLELTCDARGSRTQITLRVNGEVVVRALDTGEPVKFTRFGMFATGHAGVTLEVREISATTH
jgi:hypothetical protein